MFIVIDNLAEIIFMLVFLQIASLVGSPDQLNGVTKTFSSCLFLCYLIGFLWQSIYFGLNPTDVAYKWNITPGIIMLVVRVVIWVLFMVLAIFSGYYNTDRRWFLAVFAPAGCVYFLIIPFMVVCLSGAPFTYQWKVVLGFTQTFYFLVYCYFLALATPNPFSTRINGISFYVRKVASDLSHGNVNFLNRVDQEDDL